MEVETGTEGALSPCSSGRTAPSLARDNAPRGSDQSSERVVLLRGATAVLRDARGEDAAELRRMFYALGDTTRYFYFFTGAPSNDTWAMRVVALGVADGRTSYALVAEVEGAVVGVARFVRNTNRCAAEIGVLIEDAWQSRGLGQHMLLQLTAEARRRVVTTFTGQILGENRRAIRLARRVFPLARIALSGGVYDVSVRLDETERDGAYAPAIG